MSRYTLNIILITVSIEKRLRRPKIDERTILELRIILI